MNILEIIILTIAFIAFDIAILCFLFRRRKLIQTYSDLGRYDLCTEARVSIYEVTWPFNLAKTYEFEESGDAVKVDPVWNELRTKCLVSYQKYIISEYNK